MSLHEMRIDIPGEPSESEFRLQRIDSTLERMRHSIEHTSSNLSHFFQVQLANIQYEQNDIAYHQHLITTKLDTPNCHVLFTAAWRAIVMVLLIFISVRLNQFFY